MTEKRWLGLVLFLFVLLGVIYALVTPPFEASDELWHYPMVRHLADGNPLPVQVLNPELAGPWKQEASQPPLYYYAGAALTFWIDTSDMNEVRRENPHVDNGVITEDGNRNLVVHNPSSDPWQGTLLALRLVRFMSVLMGTATVYLTYRIASSAVPGRPELALGAAACNAFLPMFLFISGAVNNDNLAIMLSSLALFIMIAIVTRSRHSEQGVPESRSWWRISVWVILGSAIGLAILTKAGALGLLPMAWGTASVTAWLEGGTIAQAGSRTGETARRLLRIFAHSIGYFILVMVPVWIIAGWWYVRNLQLYGDLMGWSAFIAVLGQRAHPASLVQLWGERRGFLMAYWGLFGGVNVPLPGWVYFVFNTLLVFSIIGFLFYTVKETRSWLVSKNLCWKSLADILDNILRYVVDHFTLILSFLFSAAVAIGLVRWATTTWSSQGRLVFTALSALTTMYAVGLAGWMSQKTARWAMGIVSSFFFVIALAAPFLWIEPAYEVEAFDLAQGIRFQEFDITFGDQIQLHGAAVQLDGIDGTELSPGGSFWVHVDWESLASMKENWSIFIHAVDPVLGRPVAQRDMYPAQGLRLTSWMEPGTKMVNSYRLQLPETAVAPAELRIVAGFYDVASGERLQTAEYGDAVQIGTINLQPASGDFPNPVNVNFEGILELKGYQVEPRSAAPGGDVALTLYWRPLEPIDEDYTFFAQVVDQNTTRWASVDYQPPKGTSGWPLEETVIMPMTLVVSVDTPADVYPLIIGIYNLDGDGNFDRLQIQTPDGRLTEDFLELTQIRVGP